LRLYDRLFPGPAPRRGDTDFLKDLNPDSKKLVTAWLEPALAAAKAEDHFRSSATATIADRETPSPSTARVSLRDSWSAPKAGAG